MKKGIHPESRSVLFVDASCGAKFLVKSTVKTNETAIFNGKTYPLFKIETSSKSHPAYTGEKANFEGLSRVEKFRNKYKKK